MKAFDPIWEKIHSEQEWGKYPPEEIVRFVARNLYRLDRPNTKVLEIGCGTGAITWYLAREGFDAFGVDGSETAIGKGRQRLADERLAAHLSVGDVSKLDFKDAHFDAIIDSAVIYAHTVGSIREILRECHRVLKNGGRFFSSGLFGTKCTGFGKGDKLEEFTFTHVPEGVFVNRGTVHFFNRDQIVRYWQEAGFRNLKIDTVERTDKDGSTTVHFFMVESER